MTLPFGNNDLSIVTAIRSKTRAAALWGGYLLVAIGLTWPTVLHLTTHLPGDGGDDPALAWNLWWVKYALLNTGQNPFQTEAMFFPIGVNLAFYTLTVLNAVTALPLTLNWGVVTASNLHLLFSLAAAAYGAFLLVRFLLARSFRLQAESRLLCASAALAGLFYAFASSKLFYVALGQFNIASNHWAPFTVLYVIRTYHAPQRLKNAAMAGLFLTLQAWSEMTYASFLIVFIGLYWLYVLLTRQVSDFKAQVKAALLMGVTFLAGLAPILAQMIPDLRQEGDFLVEGSGFAGAFSSDLLGFLIPTMLHPWLGHLVGQTNIAAYDKGQHIYLGLTLLGLALVAAVTGYRRPYLRFWLLAALVFALLCLGPVLTINGQATGLPGPFTIFQTLPFFRGNRYPSRYSVMLLLSLSVIGAYSLVWLGNWLKKRGYPGLQTPMLLLIGALFLLEHLSIPLPQSDMRVPAPYQLVAADPAPVTVLDIPLAWRNGFRIIGPLTTQFMFGQFYQTSHQKPLLQGNTSRNPPLTFQYFVRAPVINSLLALETGKRLPPDRWQNDAAIAAEALRFFDIKYIVVRPYSYDTFDGRSLQTVTGEATRLYIEKVFPVTKIYDQTDFTIYRVDREPADRPATMTLTSDRPLAPLYLAEGWGLLTPGQPLVAQRRQVRLLIPLAEASRRITVRLRLPDGLNIDRQTVSLAVNQWSSPVRVVGQGWQEYSFDIPAGVFRPGINDLYLNFGVAQPLPAAPLLDITAVSAGEEVGGFGEIYVNGAPVSPNRRGYNVALIQANSPPTVQVASFDTHLDPTASAALVDFLAGAAPDTIVALAAADEASAQLSAAAVQAIRQTTGASGDLRGCFRCSHAIISLPTGSDRTTLESLDPLRPVGVTANLGLTEPAVAALVDWIEFE